jgi:hypothetical protein
MVEGLKERGFDIHYPESFPPDKIVEDFVRDSGECLGEQPIFEFFRFRRSMDFPGVRIYTGVKVNPAWSNIEPLKEVEVDEHLLPPVARYSRWAYWSEEVASGIDFAHLITYLEDDGFFEKLIEGMKLEEENGLAFVEKLVTALPVSFPSYGRVIDLYYQTKNVLFAEAGLEEVIGVRVDLDEFSISVGEMIPIQGGIDYFNTIGVGDDVYFVTNYQAVWYPSEKRSTQHQPGDLERQLELLEESFEVLHGWFKRRDEHRRSSRSRLNN